MRKSRFTEEQIIGVLKEHQAGLPVAELSGFGLVVDCRSPDCRRDRTVAEGFHPFEATDAIRW